MTENNLLLSPDELAKLLADRFSKEIMERAPLISIITVVYNARPDLEKTIQSVICQSFENKEFIVIDGGSTDGTLEIIRKYSKHINFWLSEPDRGIYDAMNKGLKYAKGEYVTFLNAGDYYCNGEVLKSLLPNNQEAEVIYGDIFVEKDPVKPPKYQCALDFTLPQLLAHGTAVVCHQAIFVKRRIAPYYDIRYKYKSELNWYFDIVEQNVQLKYVHVHIPVVHYSIGGFGYVNFSGNLFEWCILIIKRYGFKTFFKYKYPKLIIQKIKFRHPKLFLK